MALCGIEAERAHQVVVANGIDQAFGSVTDMLAQRIRRPMDEGTLGTPILGHGLVMLHRVPEYHSATPWRGTWASDGADRVPRGHGRPSGHLGPGDSIGATET